MPQSQSTPPKKPKPNYVVTGAADMVPTDYSKLVAIIPGAIRFYVTHDNGVKNLCDLPLNECRNYEEILGWVEHLCTQSWVDTGLLQHFIMLACQANGIEMP